MTINIHQQILRRKHWYVELNKCLADFFKLVIAISSFQWPLFFVYFGQIQETMIWYIFGKSVVYYHIFAMYRSALGSSVVSNIAFPSQPDQNGHNDENSVYTFNFPKNGVFVFNNPTILNLGEKSKANELSNHKDIPVVSGMKLLCRLSKVIKNINLRFPIYHRFL